MGKASRQKGLRGEYFLRDHLRSLGYKADRVPSSGAAQGFPGDVAFSRDGKNYLAEMKSRKSNFTTVYKMFHELQSGGSVYLLIEDGVREWCVHIADNITSILGAVTAEATYKPQPDYKLTCKKILTMQKLVKECDVLCIRDNNRPLLFLKYR